ncbi:MAG: ribonuclease P protein component [Planctomycetales bacterium]|nr:ribonuclease P protein component [Planctomycetales bacterium]
MPDLPPPTASFPAARRLKHRREMAAVFAKGKVAADDVLVVHALRSDSQLTRLGLSVAKKVGNAPQRNRWKRLIRESFRQHYQQLPSHLLLVVRPRKGATADFQAIRQSLQRLSRRLDRKL